MADCWTCTEKERLLKEAVLEHWHGVRQFRAALEASEDLRPLDVMMQATQVKMNRAEDSYRQHLRMMHETTVGTKTPAVSTCTRFYILAVSEFLGGTFLRAVKNLGATSCLHKPVEDEVFLPEVCKVLAAHV